MRWKVFSQKSKEDAPRKVDEKGGYVGGLRLSLVFGGNFRVHTDAGRAGIQSACRDHACSVAAGGRTGAAVVTGVTAGASAGLVVLVAQPWALLTSGFWLSFGATGAVIMALEWQEEQKRRGKRGGTAGTAKTTAEGRRNPWVRKIRYQRKVG